MMWVRFVVDFRGKLTEEAFYAAGTLTEFEPAIAQALVDEGRAVFADPEHDGQLRAALAKQRTKQRKSSGGVL